MMALSAAKALLWKEWRERSAVALSMLLLPPLAFACTRPFADDELALIMSVMSTLFAALLIGVTFVSGTDREAGLAFERQLPVGAMTLWACKHALGLAMSVLIALPVFFCVHTFVPDLHRLTRPLTGVAMICAFYASGAYFACCVQTSMAAALLSVANASIFCAMGVLWNGTTWPWSSWGIGGGQMGWTSVLLVAASTGPFVSRMRRDGLDGTRRIGLVVLGFVASGIGANIPGLLRYADWLCLDPSDIWCQRMHTSPMGNRVALDVSPSEKYRRYRLFWYLAAGLVYDARTETLRRIGAHGCALPGGSSPWSPDGNRLVTVDSRREATRIVEFQEESLRTVSRLPQWRNDVWLTKDRVARCELRRVAGRRQWKCCVFDVSTGEYRAAYEMADGARLLGARGPWSVYFSLRPSGKHKPWRLRLVDLRSGAKSDAALPVGTVPAVLSPDGRHLLLTSLDSSTDTKLWLYCVETGEHRQLRPVAKSVTTSETSHDSWQFSGDGRWLLLRWSGVRWEGSGDSLEALDTASGRTIVLRERVRSYGQMSISPDSRHVSFSNCSKGISLFSLSEPHPGWVIPPRGQGWLSCAWTGRDKLILAGRVELDGASLPTPIRQITTGESTTLWLAELTTRRIKMVWPRKWEHPTWRVLDREEMQETNE